MSNAIGINPSLSVGFTGTRQEPTEAQRLSLLNLIDRLLPSEFHHGDCVGADALAHDLVASRIPWCRIVIHPPLKDDLRALRKGHETRSPLSYFARNREIVKAGDLVIGIPCCKAESLSSGTGGTYYTMNYAFKAGKLVIAIWPDGETQPIKCTFPPANNSLTNP